MNEYVTIREVVDVASNAAGCRYQKITGKKILFESTLENGENIVMFTPQAKLQPQGFFWIDISSKQFEIFENYDNAILIFRLQGRLLMLVNWIDLKPYLNAKCMRSNSHEGEHWKLYIFTDHIKISGNPKELDLNAFRYTGRTPNTNIL